MKQQRVAGKNTGFTLVELLIVIVVIGILAAITLVTYNGIQQRAKTAAITSAATQWKSLIQAELVMSPTVQMGGCLGSSASDYPADGDFTAGTCVLNYYNGTLQATVGYTASAYTGWSASTVRPNGLLPTTTASINGGSILKARGIWVFSSDSTSINLAWVPQVDGQCGQGAKLMNSDSGDSINGGYCYMTISR